LVIGPVDACFHLAAAELLTKDEARRIAVNIVKLPEQGVVTKRKPQAQRRLGLLSCLPQLRLLGWRQGFRGDGVPLS